ncbi:MAG: hypothetical protein R3E39_15975 [Anaerolineae bacterium]
MSSLNTFGAILTYAIELEGRLADYYKQAGSEQANAANKRRGKLERARSLYVLEITLEPIDGLDEANYTMNLTDTSAAGQKAVAAIAARFYADVAPRINVRDAQRTLEKCGKEYAALE